MFKQGETVKIISTSNTKPLYGVNESMYKSIGKLRKIDSICSTDKGTDGIKIIIGNYMWDPADMISVDTEEFDPNKNREENDATFEFNPETLVIED